MKEVMVDKLQDVLNKASQLDREVEDITLDDFLGPLDEKEAGRCRELLRVAREDLDACKSLLEAVRKRIAENGT